MWERIIEISKTMESMLHSGKVPPNTPSRYREDLSKVNFLASKKFYVVFCSIIILAIFYAASIFVLFLTATSPSLTVPFVNIFTETIKILAVIISSYLGVQTILDFKYGSNVSTNVDYSKEEIETLTIIQTNIKEEDYELN
jgi:hypothetical protein